jgi:hypothetical protein
MAKMDLKKFHYIDKSHLNRLLVLKEISYRHWKFWQSKDFINLCISNQIRGHFCELG